MATEELTFAMSLDSDLAATAENDAAALEQLKGAIAGDVTSLREMQSALRNLKGSSTASTGAIKDLKDRIAASKASIAQSTERLVGMKGAFEKTVRPANMTEGALSRLVGGASASKGPLGGLVDKLSSTRSLLVSGGMAGGAGMIAAGLAALAVAAVAAAVSLGNFILASAGARRAELLQLEGLSKHRNYWLEMVTGQRRAADSATAMQAAIDRVSASTPLARIRIAEMHGELTRAGLRAGTLSDALESLAMVESAQGQEAAAAFKGSLLSASLYGSSIKKLSADVKSRLGGIVKAQMLDLGVQTRKLRENFAMLFADVRLDPLLQGFSDLVAMFSQSTATGRALKTIVDSLLTPLISSVSVAGPLVKKFLQGFIIGALAVTIVVLKVRNTLRDTFGGSELLKGMNLQQAALNLGMVAFSAIAGVVFAASVAFGLFVAGVAAAYATVKGLIDIVWGMTAPFRAAVDFVMGVDWLGIGSSVVNGIANGIRSGVGMVVEAMTSLADTSIKAFKQKLGIASPSKVAFAAAFEVPRGQRLALDAGRPMVKQSAARLGEATEAGLRAGITKGDATASDSTARLTPERPQSAGAGGAGSAQRGETTVTFSGDIIVNGTNLNAEQLRVVISRGIQDVIEAGAIQMGAM